MSPLCCFAILISVILYSSKCTTYSEAKGEDTSGKLSPEWIKELLNSSAGFLAGEDTPVWVAKGSGSSGEVDYERLEMGMVRNAIYYWKASGLNGFKSRKSRSVDEPFNIAEALKYSVVEHFRAETRNNSHNGDKNRTKRRTSPEVLYPSILVVMDYNDPWPREITEQRTLIYKKILYALAFWNAVDLQFRHVQNPKVRIRIAGIIVASNKEATPYLREHEGSSGLQMINALPSMLAYWRRLSTYKNTSFPSKAYHIVATMTNAKVSLESSPPTYAVAYSGPPCSLYSSLAGGIIFPDDLTFSSIQAAVHETAHALGATDHDGERPGCPLGEANVLAAEDRDIGRIWSKCSLQQLSNALGRRGWCMIEPQEFYPPGKPVKPILPGKLMPASVQCRGRGWVDGHVCWDRTTCDSLYCSNNAWYSACENIGAPPDGTTCAREKICLDGKCVSNSDIFNATSRT